MFQKKYNCIMICHLLQPHNQARISLSMDHIDLKNSNKTTPHRFHAIQSNILLYMWFYRIQVPSRNTDEEPIRYLEMFQEELVTLGLLGSSKLIKDTREFVIDDDVQLVCKYLRAFKMGTVDKLYRDGMYVRIMFTDEGMWVNELCLCMLVVTSNSVCVSCT